VKTVPLEAVKVFVAPRLPIADSLSEKTPDINLVVTSSPVPSGVRVKLPLVIGRADCVAVDIDVVDVGFCNGTVRTQLHRQSSRRSMSAVVATNVPVVK
jgi:hypothetical protein